jgi:outer membrane protein OmpA-like peptidoglycan-associated protein
MKLNQPLLMLTFILLLSTFVFNSSFNLNAQTADGTGELNKSELVIQADGNYIILGAFAIDNNAVRFNDYLIKRGMDSNIGYVQEVDLFYVYIEGFEEIEQSKSKVFELRETKDFYDAWLFRRRAGQNMLRAQQEEVLREQRMAENEQRDEVNTPAITTETEEDNLLVADEARQAATLEKANPVEEEEPKMRQEQEMTDEEEHIGEIDPNEIQRWDENIYNEYVLYLDVRDEETGKKLNGIVEAIDPQVHRLLHNLKANKLQYLGVNKKTKQEVRFETDIFGYRRKLEDINLEEPLNDRTQGFVSLIGDTVKINFELTKHRKGDIFTMYKVFFYPDAAIMKPTSEYELNLLLGMLRSNDDYHIRLIGHTNGGGVGKIVSLKEDDNNFFNVTDNNLETFGSAKKLSEERALTMKRWLMQQGIPEDRIETKGMGGKMTLYDEDDPIRAAKNVRVEIEILKD